MPDALVLPSPCVVVLVGPSASGKTTWADENFGSGRVVSSDRLRALVGGGEDDLSASADAFEVLELAVARRVARRLTTVIDTLGFDGDRRARWQALARQHGLPCVCVVFDTPARACRARNRQRAAPIPGAVLSNQLRTFRALRAGLDEEGFDAIIAVGADDNGSDANSKKGVEHVTRVRLAPSSMVAGSDVSTTGNGTLRFGLQIPSFAWAGSPDAIGPGLRAIAAQAEEAGFASLWLMDHFRQIPMFGPPWHDMLESWTTLAHLAAATSRIRLGTLVTGITYRNIGHLAKIVATADVLSGGRVTCGLGAAWYAAEHAAYGYGFPPLAHRYALLEDALQALPLLWGPGTPSFTGKVINIPEAMCYPRPLQARVPLLVGGNGERRTLALAARYADACNLIGEIELVRRKVAVLQEHCRRFDRDPAEVAVTQLSTTLVADDRSQLDALIERHRPRRMSAERWAEGNNAALVDDHVARFRILAAAGVGEAIVSLPDVGDPGAIERFASVIRAVPA